MPARHTSKTRLAMIGLAAGLCLLAACGRKGDLEPPPGAPPSEIRTPERVPVPPPEGTRPEDSFILDPLIL